MRESAALTTALASVTALAKRLKTGRKSVLDQPAIHASATSPDFLAVLRSTAVNVVYLQALCGTTARAQRPVVSEHRNLGAIAAYFQPLAVLLRIRSTLRADFVRMSGCPPAISLARLVWVSLPPAARRLIVSLTVGSTPLPRVLKNALVILLSIAAPCLQYLLAVGLPIGALPGGHADLALAPVPVGSADISCEIGKGFR
jgi:hypothetical protein